MVKRFECARSRIQWRRSFGPLEAGEGMLLALELQRFLSFTSASNSEASSRILQTASINIGDQNTTLNSERLLLNGPWTYWWCLGQGGRVGSSWPWSILQKVECRIRSVHFTFVAEKNLADNVAGLSCSCYSRLLWERLIEACLELLCFTLRAIIFEPRARLLLCFFRAGLSLIQGLKYLWMSTEVPSVISKKDLTHHTHLFILTRSN